MIYCKYWIDIYGRWVRVVWLCKFWIIINNSMSCAFLLLALVIQRNRNFNRILGCDMSVISAGIMDCGMSCTLCDIQLWNLFYCVPTAKLATDLADWILKPHRFFASGDQTEIWQPVKVDNCGCESLALVMSGIPINWICIFCILRYFSGKREWGMLITLRRSGVAKQYVVQSYFIGNKNQQTFSSGRFGQINCDWINGRWILSLVF